MVTGNMGSTCMDFPLTAAVVVKYSMTVVLYFVLSSPKCVGNREYHIYKLKWTVGERKTDISNVSVYRLMCNY